MLDFFWHLRGSVPLKGVASNRALDRISIFLEKQQKPVIERGSDYLVFDDPFWRNPLRLKGCMLELYDRGLFWIQPGHDGAKLRYQLRSLHSLLFCLLGASAAFAFGLVHGGPVLGLKVGVGVLVWLYGMNVLLALARIPTAIGKAVRST